MLSITRTFTGEVPYNGVSEEFPYVADRSLPFPCVSRHVFVHGHDPDLQRVGGGLDVDIVIVQYPDGRQDRYFVPGANPPQDPEQVPCTYDVDSKGRVIPGPPVYREIVRGRWPGAPYDSSFGIEWPVLPPHKFGPGLGGWYPGGNWNDDIEKAKKRKYKR